MKSVLSFAFAAGIGLMMTTAMPGEANAISLTACPSTFTADGTAKVYYGATLSAAGSCQYLDPPGNHNDKDSDPVSGSNLNINDIDGGGGGPGFFGITGWASVGQVDPANDQAGSWAIPGTVDFAHYAYMLMFKDGGGTDLLGFLLNEEASSGSWTTPFTDPPFTVPNPKDVSHFTYYRYLDCALTDPTCGGGGPGPGPVPEPASLVLLGTGLLGFAAIRRRRRRA